MAASRQRVCICVRLCACLVASTQKRVRLEMGSLFREMITDDLLCQFSSWCIKHKRI